MTVEITQADAIGRGWSRDFFEIYQKHQAWLKDANEGESADLHGFDLSGFDLHGVDLRHADLSGVDLSDADLTGAKIDKDSLLYETSLWGGVNFTGVILSGLSVSKSRKIVINRMNDLRITDAKGLGAAYEDQNFLISDFLDLQPV